MNRPAFWRGFRHGLAWFGLGEWLAKRWRASGEKQS